MLSILIPAYNYDIRVLVETLHQQAEICKIVFEIVVLDDASNPSFQELNRPVENLPKVRYLLAEENLGRSRVRNRLAELAAYEYLLFMDCDSMPLTEHYIQKYVAQLAPNILLYGGRVYKTKAPAQAELYFHWFYGHQREQVAASIRAQHPHRSFMTNNFLIPKTIFQAIRFDERLNQYGHEDTLFGLELRERKIEILHLDNPLEHTGLESADDFLRKSRKAIENLYFLSKEYDLDDIKLLRYFRKTRLLHLPIFWFYKLFAKQLLKNLKSTKPRLGYFDFYKLGYLIQISKGAVLG